MVHAVWFDDRDGNQEIYYKRNSTVNPVTEVTSIEGLGTFRLEQNCPNPVLRRTVVRYQILHETGVVLSVCNSAGRVVTTLVRGRQKAGTYTVSWDFSSVPCSVFPSGTYFCRLEAGGYTATRKMVKSE